MNTAQAPKLKENPEEVVPKQKLTEILEDVNMSAMSVFSGTGKDCYVMLDENCPSGALGYTVPDESSIAVHLNPTVLANLPPQTTEAVCLHEVGHHFPPTTEFQHAQLETLEDPNIVPDAYRSSPEHTKLFLEGMHGILGNLAADVVNESFLGRYPFEIIRNKIEGARRQLIREGRERIEKMGAKYVPPSLPEQLCRLIAYDGRYQDEFELEGHTDPLVLEAYRRLEAYGVTHTLEDATAFENFFSTPRDQQECVKRKGRAYREFLIPEYTALVEEELNRRRENMQKAKTSAGGKGKKGRGASSAVPLTPEEEQELIKELLEELKKAGEKNKPAAPTEGEEKETNSTIQGTVEKIEAITSGGKKSPHPEVADKKPKDQGLDETMRKLSRAAQESADAGQSQALGVEQETIKRWREIRKKYEREITSTASVLADVFIDDRKRKLTGPQREGEIIEGLEAETVAALMSGDLDPETRRDWEKFKEFLETEIEFIVDTSGSMSGEKLEKSVDMLVVVTEAFKTVKEDLLAQKLAEEGSDPFRIGVTAFDFEARRITTLDEELNDKKEVKIISELSQAGGGTNEVEALSDVYTNLSLRRGNVIKLVIVLTDGQGNPAGVAPIMQKIEKENEVVFLALGLGRDPVSAQAIVNTYLAPLSGRERNVFGHAASNPQEILPAVLSFIKREVEKKRRFQ